jgi:hypothetical protein
MLKKISTLFIVLLMNLFLVVQPANAATINWEAMVNGTFTGTRSPGFGDNNNILAMSMVTHDGYVYVSNYNDTTGTEIWRSSDGTTWEQVNNNGFGVEASSFAILASFNNNLYAINWFILEGHIDILRYDGVLAWTNTGTIGNMTNPTEAIVYNNSLYVSVYTGAGKSAVYSSTDAATWNMVNNDGFGDANNEIIQAMAVYNSQLYAGTWNDSTGTEIWYFDGANWTQSNSDGFDNDSNVSTGSLTSFSGALYASTFNGDTGAEVWKSTIGTSDWTRVADAGIGQGATMNYTYSSSVFKDKMYIGGYAAKVFRTADGNTYEQVNTDGFGYDDNDVVVFTVMGDYLYAGTGLLPGGRQIQGGPNTTEIYRYYEPSAALPQTGYDSPLNKYILDALM